MGVLSNSEAYNSVKDQVANGVVNGGRKWFALHDNILDGTFHLTTTSEEVGWWSGALSDATGSFSTPQELTLEYNRAVHVIRIVGDDISNNYPVDFTVKLYNGTTLLHTITVTNNNSLTYQVILDPVYDTTKVVLSITKISLIGTPAKIIEALNPFNFKRFDVNVLSSSDHGVMATPLARADVLTLSKEPDAHGTYDLAEQLNSEQVIDADAIIQSRDPYHYQLMQQFLGADPLGGVDVSTDSQDSLQLTITEVSRMTNIYTRMDDAERTVLCKVEITYSDPFTDETIVVTDSGAARFTSSKQIADGLTGTPLHWFALHDNILNGNHHMLPSGGEHSVGWWSATSSDGTGTFASPPFIEVAFQARAINDLKVVGDSEANVYPVNFDLILYDASGTILHQEVVTNNSQVAWYSDIPDVINVSKMKLVIRKINKPNQPARIVEFFTAVVEEYDADRIESLHLLEEIEYPVTGVSLGAVSSNEIDIILDNSDKRFSLNNPLSPISNQLKRNRRVRAWLGAEIVPGVTEWYPLGVFWTIDWQLPTDSIDVSLTARDRLEILRLTDFNTSLLYVDKSLYELFELVLLDAGLKLTEFYIDPELEDTIIPYAWFPRTTHRGALQRLAESDLVQVFCDRNGLVVVQRVDPTDTVMASFDDDVNLFSRDFPMSWTQLANYVEVQSVTWTPGESQTVVEDTEVITLASGQSIALTYEFTSIPVANVQSPTVEKSSGIIVDSFEVFAWGIRITYKNTGGTSGTVTSLQVVGDPLQQLNSKVATAKDDVLIKQDGKVATTIMHDFIQSSTRSQYLANSLLNLYKEARQDVVLNCRGNIALRLGDRVTADSASGVPQHYMVSRQDITWAGYLEAKVDGKKL